MDEEIKFWITIILSIIATIIQFINPTTGLVIYIVFLGVLIVYVFISSNFKGLRQKINQINQNTGKVQRLEEDLNILKEKYELAKNMEEVKAKMNIIEELVLRKKKKGQVDPRWILIIIMILLLILLLRAKGLI